MKNMNIFLMAVVILMAGNSMVTVQPVLSHCQIPCGIYDDHARVQAMLEDAQTVEKSMKLIAELAGKTDAQSQNQMVRWVNNKELHAQKIIETICDYYLTQRVKPSQSDYAERLAKHHNVMLLAMKTKQSVDLEHVKALKEAISALLKYYPEHTH